MTPWWRESAGRAELWLGDVREVLAEMPAESVSMCCTSPPYWGLRDYGLAPSVWDDPGGCAHEWGEDLPGHHPGQVEKTKWKNAQAAGHGQTAASGAYCQRCSAWKGCLGLEPDIEGYVRHLVEVFRGVMRVLHPSGVCWINLGDSYASSSSAVVPSRQPQHAPACGIDGRGRGDSQGLGSSYSGLCDGCQVGSPTHPHRTFDISQQTEQSVLLPLLTDHDSEHQGSVRARQPAFARGAQASTMRESSQPLRGVCSHCENCGACLEVLRSSSRDGRLCARKAACSLGNVGLQATSDRRMLGRERDALAYPYSTSASHLKPKDLCLIPFRVALALQEAGWWVRQTIIWAKPNPMPESVDDRPTTAHEYVFLLSKRATYYYDSTAIREGAVKGSANAGSRNYRTWAGNGRVHEGQTEQVRSDGRSKRSVWEIASEPFPGAHYACFPRKLVEPCILAGTSARGVCAACGAPWRRVVERGERIRWHSGSTKIDRPEGQGSHGISSTLVSGCAWERVATGWEPTCGHDAGVRPATVLDPFIGSGTTAEVALRLGRHAVGVDLSEPYLVLARKRLAGVPLTLPLEVP